MYSQSDLFVEVCKIIDDTVDKGQQTQASWIATSVITKHPEITGNDSDFYTLCAREHVRDTVRSALRRYKPQAGDSDPNLVLPGFKRLLKAYPIEREGDQVIVPIDQLSDPELDAKINELRAMGEGCFEHADELTRYKGQRKTPTAAPAPAKDAAA